MKNTVIHYKPFISREEILQNIMENDGKCYLQLIIHWDGASTESLNNLLDEVVEEGYLLEDMSYTPIWLDPSQGLILFEVCVKETGYYEF